MRKQRRLMLIINFRLVCGLCTTPRTQGSYLTGAYWSPGVSWFDDDLANLTLLHKCVEWCKDNDSNEIFQYEVPAAIVK